MVSKKNIVYKRLRQSIVVNGFILACFFPQGSIDNFQVQTLTVICNQKGAPDAMKFSELKSIMKGERQRWKDGTKVTLAIMKTDTDIGKNTARVIYNMSGNELSKYNLAQHFQGTSLTKFFNTTSELQSYVAQNPGAIGVIDQALVTNDIKIITIDGKSSIKSIESESMILK